MLSLDDYKVDGRSPFACSSGLRRLAAPKLGKLGPTIGWPLSLMAGLLTANAWGFFTGEWKLTGLKDRRWMAAGGLVLLAIITLGRSSTLRRSHVLAKGFTFSGGFRPSF